MRLSPWGTAVWGTAVWGGGEIPLLTGRGLVGGAPAAYVCRGFACLAPVTDPEALRAALSGAALAG